MKKILIKVSIKVKERKMLKLKRRINQVDFNQWVSLVFSSHKKTNRFLSGLSAPVFRAIMKRGYKVPTPIQRKVGLMFS